MNQNMEPVAGPSGLSRRRKAPSATQEATDQGKVTSAEPKAKTSRGNKASRPYIEPRPVLRRAEEPPLIATTAPKSATTIFVTPQKMLAMLRAEDASKARNDSATLKRVERPPEPNLSAKFSRRDIPSPFFMDEDSSDEDLAEIKRVPTSIEVQPYYDNISSPHSPIPEPAQVVPLESPSDLERIVRNLRIHDDHELVELNNSCAVFKPIDYIEEDWEVPPSEYGNLDAYHAQPQLIKRPSAPVPPEPVAGPSRKGKVVDLTQGKDPPAITFDEIVFTGPTRVTPGAWNYESVPDEFRAPPLSEFLLNSRCTYVPPRPAEQPKGTDDNVE